MYLYRENHERVKEARNAVIQACRDNNEVRNEVRKIIQEIKNVPFRDATIDQTIDRYDRLTRAQSFMADERCIPLRTGGL